MDKLTEIGTIIYAYCTDFIINLANLTHSSYYEINALIFCIAWPIITLCLILFFLYSKLRLKQAQKHTVVN